MPINIVIVPEKSLEGSSWRRFAEHYQFIYNDPLLLKKESIVFLMEEDKWNQQIAMESNQHLQVRDYHLPIRLEIFKYKGVPEFSHLAWLDATSLGECTWDELEEFSKVWGIHETIIEISVGDIKKTIGKKVLFALLITFLDLFGGYLRVPDIEYTRNGWANLAPNLTDGYYRKAYLEDLYQKVLLEKI